MSFLELKWPNDLEGQDQWPPFSTIPKRIPRCIFGVNLVILAQICDELSHRQAKFPRILSQNGQNDLEGQGQWPPFSIPAESIPGCMFGRNLVIPAQICDELSCRQAKVYGQTRRTDRRTDGRTSFSMNKPTTWCKSGRVSLVSFSCLYKTQPERALPQVCHTRIDALSPDEYQFHLLLHRNSHHSQATYPKWLNH